MCSRGERGALPSAATREGYRLLFWKKDDLEFAAISDTGAEELDRLKDLMIRE